MISATHSKTRAQEPSSLQGDHPGASYGIALPSRSTKSASPDTRTCSLSKKKDGTLVIYDEVLHTLMIDRHISDQSSNLAGLGSDMMSVKHTRLYEIIVAKAMYMVIGEWQKRDWLRKVVELVAGETGGNAGGFRVNLTRIHSHCV
ncbi:hypothetical protein FKW77_005742 [Venturia effusa]|uniref:Uncharacterized protein n=1 Tax=Venturia effusa TaxID=50376 RepID=A0A517LHA4_9PEZI|nr:hypothetical protein FKW77_005742 [Venturia effusa]